MKTNLLRFILAVLTLGLLGSCSKINECIDGLDKRVYGLENNQIASVEQQITAINTSITDLKAADETIGGKIGDLKTTAEALQALIDALKEADKALVQKDDALEARITTLEGQVAIINGQIKALEDADKAINARIDELKSYIDTELGKTKDWASATFATLEEYRQTAVDLATLSVTVSGINTTLAAVQTSINTLDTKIDGIDAALQGKIADAKTELEGKISSLKTELEGKITEAISTSEDNLKGWVNEQLSGYYTIAQTDAKIKSLQDEIDILNTDNETNKTKIAELEANLTQLTQALEEAKTTIKTEYEAAIATAIEEYNGTITQTIQSKIDEVNATITALTARVETLETTVGILSGRIDAAEARINTINQQIAAINTSITDLKAADETIGGKIGDLKTTAEALQTLIDALKEADKALGQKDDALEARIAVLEGQVNTINGKITALEEADKAINARIDELKSYIDTELGKTKDWASATFATLEEYRQTAAELATLSVTVSGINTTLAAVQTSITTLDTKIDGIDAALQGKIADAKTELEGKISSLKTELEGKITEAISTSEDNLEGWVNEQLSGYYTIAEIDVEIAGLQSEIDILNTDNETNKTKIAELETKLNNLSDELTQAKATIKTEYEAAIAAAITVYNGTITQTINQKIAEVNATITALTARVETLETTVGILSGRIDAAEVSIATINQQINAINSSIADLETIRASIQSLIEAKTALGEDITALKAADEALEAKIDELKAYVDTELANYGTKDWVNATFATLEKQAEIMADIEQLKQDLDDLDTELDQAIANLNSSLQGWVNEQLSGYYTIAEINVIIAGLQDEIDILNTDNETNKNKIAELETKLNNLSAELTQAKATIKTAYEKAISDAINGNDGYINSTIQNAIDAANADITTLTGRVATLESDVATLKNDVAALKAMIQTVSIIPAYNDGSLKAEGGILTINCVITPKKAVDGLTKENFTVLTSEVLTKAGLYGTIAIANDEDLVLDKENGTATIKVDVSAVLPAEEGKALAVALNVKNGISDFTTEFVPVYVVPLPEGALKGVFSVSTTKKVHFSQGNLQATYNGSSYTWSFAASQYAYVGKAAGNTTIGSQTSGAVVDLFGWSTASTTYGISKSTFKSDYSGDFKDWGTAIDDKGTWRTLTTAEWQYLFNNHVKVWGQCNSVNGYFIAPNGFVGDASTLSSLVSDWTAAEAAGIVFLPAAGYRYGSDVHNVGDSGSGSYWSSSTASDKYDACRVFFCSSYDSHGNGNRNYGYSVRLITEPGAPAPQVISVESVSLNKSTLELAVGSDETLTATVTPENATDKNVSWSSSDESVATVDASGKVTAIAAGTATITVTTTDGGKTTTCAVTVIPAGALAGEFSVSATKKVHFSKGNLQATYNGSSYTWSFAASQYAYVGNAAGNTTIGSQTSCAVVDLFGWSTDAASNNWGIHTKTISTAGYTDGDFKDWGKNIGDGNTWRTLSKDEWTYLFENHYCIWATVNGVTGYVIAPDGFTGELEDSYANDAALASAGNLVFLPAAGYRSGSNVDDVGGDGYYWSSTAGGEYDAYSVFFDSLSVNPAYRGYRNRGFSVRLITESK